MKVWGISDLHSDHKRNMEWVEGLDPRAFAEDALIVAGDIAHDVSVILRTLKALKRAFKAVFYTVGNHELWHTRRDAEMGVRDSAEKASLILEACKGIGVDVEPRALGGVWVVPVLSWYHKSWDREPGKPPGPPVDQVMSDFMLCKWPRPDLNANDDSLAVFFDRMNEPAFSSVIRDVEEARSRGERPFVVSFSHFLPLRELMPPRTHMRVPCLAHASGSDHLLRRVLALRPDIHLFGHTHFAWDATVAGTRYIQRPLGYPRDQAFASQERLRPCLLYDTAKKESSGVQRTYWSGIFSEEEAAALRPPWFEDEVKSAAVWTGGESGEVCDRG